MIAKAGLGLIGLGAISVGGVALANPGWLGMRSQMPDYHTLKEDSDFGTAYNGGTSKFGKKYGRYLVGVNAKTGGNKKNENWWEWALGRLDNDRDQQGKFKDVKNGYGDNSQEHLSRVCKDAYGTEESSFSDDGGTNFKKSEVWKYCSIGGTQPQTIQEFTSGTNAGTETYGADTIGTDSAKRSTFLSIKSEANKWIWDLKDKDFSSENITDGFFKTRQGEANRKSIKDICEEAYGQKEKTDGTGLEKVTKTDTEKYCSLTGTNN